MSVALGFIRNIERYSLVGIFLTMVALFFINILIREFAGTIASDFAWIEEAVRIMNGFLVFLGLGLALEKGRHVSINTIHSILPTKIAWFLYKIIDATGCLFSLYLVWQSYSLVKFVLMTGQTSPTLDLPMGWIYTAPVIGFSLLALRYALSFFGIINRFSNQGES
ncbi:MAG: C4-dicarboxylate ABC transporter permease [Hyphomicrobiales bacterium]|nr:MAG: C4-dicarboxylate ABC transporter permease [Hyphomicrobiales bacterium]